MIDDDTIQQIREAIEVWYEYDEPNKPEARERELNALAELVRLARLGAAVEAMPLGFRIEKWSPKLNDAGPFHVVDTHYTPYRRVIGSDITALLNETK